MKKTIFICISLFSSLLQAQTPIEGSFKLKWSTPTGFTNFRANICYQDGKLIIPSNGLTKNGNADEKDGIYILEAKTGNVLNQIKPLDPQKEGDVASCSVGDGKIFFGNDAGWIYCYDLSGKKIWSRMLKGEFDIEAAPVLVDLNNDKILDAVFNQEAQGTFAVDGKNGKTLWENAYEDNSGYMNSPSAYDVSGDKIPDIIVGTKRPFSDGYDYGNSIRVINGATGKEIWSQPIFSAIHSSPLIWINQGVPMIVVTECYSNINFFNTKGELQQVINLNEPEGGISGLFSTPAFAPNGSIVVGTSWWEDEDGIWFVPNKKEHYKLKKTSNLDKLLNQYEEKYRLFTKTGRVSASACVADILGNGQYQFIIPTEKGELLIFSNTGEVLKRLILPEPTEATPLIKDIDGDGFLEIVICGENKTYCYKTGSKGRVYWGQFKGSNAATGLIRY